MSCATERPTCVADVACGSPCGCATTAFANAPWHGWTRVSLLLVVGSRCLERSRAMLALTSCHFWLSHSAAHGRGADVEGLSDRFPRRRGVLSAHLPSDLDPLSAHHRWPPTDATLGACVLQTQPGVLPNRVHAQLCEYGDDAEQGSAHRGRGVDHQFGEALDVDALVLQFVQRLDQDALGPAEPIEAAHQQHVAGAEVVHARDPLRAVLDPAGVAVVDEHALRSCRVP